MPQGSLKHDADQIGWAIRKAIAPAENKILIIAEKMDVATLDERQMRNYGWVKAEKATKQRDELLSMLEEAADIIDTETHAFREAEKYYELIERIKGAES